MEIKKVESVVMTGAELAKIISYYVKDHYKKDMEFKWIVINSEEIELKAKDKIIFETEQV